MNRSLLVYFLLSALHAGSLFGQASYSYAKARRGKWKSTSQASLKSVRFYNDREGQVLFIRRIKAMKEQESWGIFEEPGGEIRFFSREQQPYATISLGQTEAEVRQLEMPGPHEPIWQMTVPGDTVFFQSHSDPSSSANPPTLPSGFRLYKKLRPHSAILTVSEEVEVDLLHFWTHPQSPSLIRIESQESLEDYSELFPIMCVMMIFRNQIGT